MADQVRDGLRHRPDAGGGRRRASTTTSTNAKPHCSCGGCGPSRSSRSAGWCCSRSSSRRRQRRPANLSCRITILPDVASAPEHAGRPCAAPAARHVRRRDDRAGLDDRRRHLRGAGPRSGRGRLGSAHRAGRRRRGRVLQRDVVRTAGRAVSAVRRHLRLRARASRRVLGLHRRVELRRRQDRVLRGDGADGRLLRLAGTGRTRSRWPRWSR